MGAIENFDLRSCVADSVSEAFRTRLSMEPALIEAAPPPEPGIDRLAGVVHFAGSVTGLFIIRVTADFGRTLAAGMFGMAAEEADLDIEARSLVAEIATAVGGRLKSALNDAGLVCFACSPSVIRGTDFTLKSMNMDRFERCVFRKDDHILIAEVGLKAAADAQMDFDMSAPGAMGRIPSVEPSKLDALDFPGEVSGAVRDVFESMVSMNLEAAPTASGDSLTDVRGVSSVCLAGEAAATVSIGVEREGCRFLAAALLGRKPAELEDGDDVANVLGRLVSTVGGRLKSALAEIGLRCALSAPCFTFGSNFTIEAVDLERCEQVAFQAQGHRVVVDWGVRFSEPAMAGPAAGTGPRSPKADSGARKRQPEDETAPVPEDFGLEMLLDIPVELTVELGRTKMPIRELLKLQPGSTARLSRLEGEPVDILASDVLIARGEVVVRNEKYGIRITEITSRMERLRKLK
jgi:flagellar motor switch protein FliN/FliY